MLKLGQSHYEALRQHGEETYPYECCGALLGHFEGERKETRVITSIARTENTRKDSPRNRYSIDPKEVIHIEREARERGEEIVGFYHSHPDHPAQWSQTDLAEANWLDCSYVITSIEQGKAVLTNSFVLMGSYDDKKLVDEKIEVV